MHRTFRLWILKSCTCTNLREMFHRIWRNLENENTHIKSIFAKIYTKTVNTSSTI